MTWPCDFGEDDVDVHDDDDDDDDEEEEEEEEENNDVMNHGISALCPSCWS